MSNIYFASQKALPFIVAAKDDTLDLQKVYKFNRSNNEKRISLCLDDGQHMSNQQAAVKQTSTEMNAVSIMMNHEIKKALWVDDPLRLNLLEQEETAEEQDETLLPFAHVEELPFTFKLKSHQVETNTFNALFVALLEEDQDYVELMHALPFATAGCFPPTPPPKALSSTPAMPPPIILPVELYQVHEEPENLQQQLDHQWLYTREEDQSTVFTYSPRMSTTTNSIFFDAEDGHRDFTEETWDAIFHPLSTFKHNKGALEYYAWNPSNLPVAAARVARRVVHAKAFGSEDDTVFPSCGEDMLAEATIPQLQATPPLKPSPVLSIIEMEPSERPSDGKDGHYYAILKEIRGNQRYSNGSTIASSLHSSLESHSTEIASTPVKHTVLSHILHFKPKMDEKDEFARDPEDLTQQETRYWNGKKLFWGGFVCPLLWFYACFYLRASARTQHPSDMRWQKRCRMAAVYSSVVFSVIIMVAVVKSAGVAGARQAQSDTIRAVIAN